MDQILHGLAIFLGIILRFAIPVGLTVLLARFLYHLDRRWQKEARLIHSDMIQALQADPSKPCWELLECTGNRRENCQVYQDQITPCWQNYDQNGVLAEKCLNCVFPKLVEAKSESPA